jgi:4'-phosphopantetheinyl transferase
MRIYESLFSDSYIATESMSIYDLNLIREEKVYKGAICFVSLSLHELISRRHGYLGKSELARYDAIPVDRRRFTFLCGRFAAKKALCRLRPSLDPASFEIVEGIFGQPILPSAELHGLQVGISHTDRTAGALAFPEAHPMGIDLECIREDRDRAIQSQMTEREMILHRSLSCSESAGYALLWTIKESLSKVLKCGMMTPFTVLEIDQIDASQEIWVSTFRNFSQYKALSQIRQDEVLSITLPKRTELNLEIPS